MSGHYSIESACQAASIGKARKPRHTPPGILFEPRLCFGSKRDLGHEQLYSKRGWCQSPRLYRRLLLTIGPLVLGKRLRWWRACSFSMAGRIASRSSRHRKTDPSKSHDRIGLDSIMAGSEVRADFVWHLGASTPDSSKVWLLRKHGIEDRDIAKGWRQGRDRKRRFRINGDIWTGARIPVMLDTREKRLACLASAIRSFVCGASRSPRWALCQGQVGASIS